MVATRLGRLYCPQIYWYIGQTGSDYNILVPWWNNNAFGRHIYSGMAGYKVGDAAQNAAFATDNNQIPNQVRLNRQNTNIKGQIFYNTTSLRNNKLGFRDSLQLNFYVKPALQPTMSWKDNVAPLPATSLNAVASGLNAITLNWTKPASVSNELDNVKRFAIYRSTTTTVDISNANNLLAITWNDTTAYTDLTAVQGSNYYYVVTALDRLQNESSISNTASVVTTSVSTISGQEKIYKIYPTIITNGAKINTKRISSLSDKSTYIIFDATGKLMQQGKIDNLNTTIQLNSGINKGTYFIKLISSTGLSQQQPILIL